LQFAQSNLGFEIVSPPSLSGHHLAPSLEFNNQEYTNQNQSELRQLFWPNFDFCSEYKESIENLENLVVLIDAYNCLPTQKAKFAENFGAKQVIIQGRVTPPGMEIQIYKNEQRKYDIYCVIVDTYTFNLLVYGVQNGENITMKLIEDENPWKLVYDSDVIVITYMALTSVFSFSCLILALTKLFFRLKDIRIRAEITTNMGMPLAILTLGTISLILSTVENAIDPIFLRGILPYEISVIFLISDFLFMVMANLMYQLYWTHLSTNNSPKYGCLLTDSRLSTLFWTDGFALVIWLMFTYILWLRPPVAQATDILFIIAFFFMVMSGCLSMLVIYSTAYRLYLVFKGSIAIPKDFHTSFRRFSYSHYSWISTGDFYTLFLPLGGFHSFQPESFRDSFLLDRFFRANVFDWSGINTLLNVQNCD